MINVNDASPVMMEVNLEPIGVPRDHTGIDRAGASLKTMNFDHRNRERIPSTIREDMTDENDLRAAKQFIERFGNDAPRQARQRAEELSIQGDSEAATVWLRLVETVTALLESEPPGNRAKH